MRSRSDWHQEILSQLSDGWPDDVAVRPGDLLDVELGLRLLERVTPTWTAIDAWTLLGGYPYSDVLAETGAEQRLMIRRARHYLWDLRRRYEWRRLLSMYLEVPRHLRAYDFGEVDETPVRRDPSRAARRFDVYDRLLTSPPTFVRSALPRAEAGQFQFVARERHYAVTIPAELVPDAPNRGHDLTAMPAALGAAIEVSWKELEAAARSMDALEQTDGERPNRWTERLQRVELLMRDDAAGRFSRSDAFRVDGLLNLVGMVGAGKSTVRDILAFWAATRSGRHITIVVGDVAETLAIVHQFERLGLSAAPILGQSTRERHIERLHRRVAGTGAASMLQHRHPGFTFLSSACPLDALRGFEAPHPLAIGEAPCGSLIPVEPAEDFAHSLASSESPEGSRRRPGRAPRRHSCPLWSSCPRHHGARSLVDAQIWVTTSAGLVHSAVPRQLQDENLRYLELVCRRSDLVIVDEADRVQIQLDAAFAPSLTLIGRSPNSWLDQVAGHAVSELARRGRIQLSAREVDDWTGAVNTVTAAANRLYALLINDSGLRGWITEEYFSAHTLHQWLINAWFPEDHSRDDHDQVDPERLEAMRRVGEILDQFRNEPLEMRSADSGDELAPEVNQLVALALELLHAPRGSSIRDRLRSVLLDLVELNEDIEAHTTRFEFTLILAALHHRLNFMTTLWPRVEAALNLESASNVLSRRPPRDYEPMIPESPMGNVLGFQFRPGERERDGDQSGELSFFRCGGVGRELLMELHNLPAVDDRPGPNVLFMSATSWAGTSSRYHLHAPVGAVLRPHQREVEAVLGTEFRKEFLHWPDSHEPLRLSGAPPEQRGKVLTAMLRQLAEPDRSLTGATSMLEDELAAITDPDRRRVLLLVGSYQEAEQATTYLRSLPEWKDRVVQLISDDADLDTLWTLRRGDVAAFGRTGGEILVAPLLAVERGHNIVLPDGRAAIGTAYFLARPHPRPDDISLAVNAINDWAVRQIRDGTGEFRRAVRSAGSADAAARSFRAKAAKLWNRYLTRQLIWSHLPEEEKNAFTWDQLVVIWQVIGRLVRGGVPARVVFVDAAFSPREAGFRSLDTPDTSLLVSMRELLAPYFDEQSSRPALDKSLVEALYEPLYRALVEMN
ncbi:signal recognition particle [Kribbella italica]|uniref:pPIWI-RE three-gene island domain-containing protein n=1 Tax=Kribbella italica TaxID=1540520 RepID=A0A7W9JG89_9ACTN|nr:signal recognition particle [Kribbella italica]MBB5841581.1 hypothetical protein [Kribbella italica]